MTTTPIGFIDKRKLKSGVELSSWIKTVDNKSGEIYGVFNGGGAKGAAFSGAIEVFDSKFDWKGVAGTSAGAITAAFIASGYSGESIKEIVKELDLSSLMDISELKDVQESTRPWINAPRVDIVTQVLSDIDHSMLCSHSEYQFKLKNKAIFSKRPYFKKTVLPLNLGFLANRFSGTISKKASGYLIDMFSLDPKLISSLDKDIHNLLFFKRNWSIGSINSQTRRKSLRNIMLSLLGKKLPDFILSKIQNESDDKLLSLFLGLYYKGGAFSGKYFTETMEQYLQKALRKDIDLERPVTFSELPIELHVMASDISSNRLVNLPNDLIDYGYQNDEPESENYFMNFSVAQAIRASMSIPLVYQPCMLENPVTGEEFQLVDGGLLSNFPLAAFNQYDDDVPVCGFWLGDDIPKAVNNERVLPFVNAHFNTLMESYDKVMNNLLSDKVFMIKIGLEITPIESEMLLKGIPKSEGNRSRKNRYLKKLEEFRSEMMGKLKFVNLEENRLFKKHIEATDLTINEIKQELDGFKKLILVRNCNTLDFDLTDSQKNELHNNGKIASQKEIDKVSDYLVKTAKY